MSIWKGKSSNVDKPWGSEVLFESPFSMSGKIINILKGRRTSLKYYQKSDQCIYCFKGKLKVYAPNEHEFGINQILEDGDILYIQRGGVYRLEALEECILIESIMKINNWPETPVRIEDDYNR